MFPAARCFVPLHPQPHATIPCRRAPARTAVSAKPRRWTRGPRRDRSWDDDGGGSGSDADADDGFFGQEQDDDEEPEREEAAAGRTASPAPAPAGGQLRGSDVLRAMQRAAAAKEAARRKNDKKPVARRRAKEKPEGGDVEVREVRPVVIRPEWAARIRELELRVQQLADKYHHHQ
ncbi:hypothetical protein GQ55_4G350700 [Panicum hallii var. hallii]|jgi:hypothetical protein|uniref:Uncharacterized protein n=1 Tax=Panicum hallii var. hallii TaxID=1504633 RepID=A0A2T7E3H7_9POAL|nr:uncharacterized protein LOC112888743 [Panicum hallii]PUZ62358.1 hypothetical protein GQ55_4G350700 [Panicum hallii var. hallii]